MRLWSDTLAGRTLSLLIGMTLLLIVGSALLLHEERKERFDERSRFHLVERVTTLVRLLDDADEEERERIIKQVSEKGDHIQLSDQPQITERPGHPVERVTSRELRDALRLHDRSAVRVGVELGDHDNNHRGGREWRRDRAGIDSERHRDHRVDRERHHGSTGADGERRRDHDRIHDLKGIRISIRLSDGNWLNFWTNRFEAPPPWSGNTLQLLALLLVLVTIFSFVIAWRMARPMAQLADAANRFGLGRTQAPLSEQGSREVRNTIRAFNLMQERLHKHISDRSQMLAAVAHDLRTPITTLRLRAEYIEDAEMREKTLATLAEMEAILSATLGFARDDAADEKARSTDLAALLQSLVDDHADLGGDASYEGPDRSIFTCRPIALKRALNNLIDNALKYGETAKVRLSEDAVGVEILVDDSGPGIPENNLENVFTPFVRLEASRNRETGGTGLGLSVARTIVHAHGGQLSLVNRPDGGLRAVMRLPR